MSLVVPYQDRWPTDFLAIRDYIISGLSTYVSIEHIGSTSIPGMVAKPIIDLMIVVPEGAMSRAIAELARLEYRHQGDLGNAGREAFDYLPPRLGLPVHHLYACYPSHHQLAGSRAFCDFLKANREWREKLSSLKLELDRVHASDRQKYMAGKKALVEEIIEKAKQAGRPT